jgi:hypothetical protein
MKRNNTTGNKDHANDNGDAENGAAETKAKTSVAAAAMGSTAPASLQAIGAVIGGIDPSGHGSSSKPMLSYKSREGSWQIGRQRNIAEEGARWIVNVLTATHGYVCFDGNNKPTSKMTPAHTPMPNKAELPDTGFEWNVQKAFELKCLDGQDQGAEVEFRTTADGGIRAFNDLFDAVKARYNSGKHDDLFPIVKLEQSSYHNSYGRIADPVFHIVGWATIDGPQSEPEPAPTSPPPPKSPPGSTTRSEQPRRRRVGYPAACCCVPAALIHAKVFCGTPTASTSARTARCWYGTLPHGP